MGFSIGNALKGAVGGFTASGGNPWGAVAGGALGGFSNEKSAEETAYDYWKKQFGKQTEFEKWKMSNAHQLEMADLEKAGLNPALTATGSTAGAIAGGAAPNPGQMPEWAGNYGNTTMRTGLQAISLNQQAVKNQAEIENLKQQASKTKSETTGQNLNNEIVAKYGSEQAKRNLANTILQGENINANTGLQIAQKQKQVEETLNEIENRKPIERSNEFYKNHPILGSIITGINEAATPIKMIGSAVAGSLAVKRAGEYTRQIEKGNILKEKQLSLPRNYRQERYNAKGVHSGTTYREYY